MPSTKITSCNGSTRVPNAVTTSSLTSTRPSVIRSSATRREAIPAAAITFCKRSPSGTCCRDFCLVLYLFCGTDYDQPDHNCDHNRHQKKVHLGDPILECDYGVRSLSACGMSWLFLTFCQLTGFSYPGQQRGYLW